MGIEYFVVEIPDHIAQPRCLSSNFNAQRIVASDPQDFVLQITVAYIARIVFLFNVELTRINVDYTICAIFIADKYSYCSFKSHISIRICE